MRNLVTVVQAIVDRSLFEARNIGSARTSVRGRLAAVARALAFVFRDANAPIPLDALFETILKPFQDEQGRIRIEGEDASLPGRLVTLACCIAALDCAERGQTGAAAATERMRALVRSVQLTCSLTGRRSYDRWIGSCRLADGRDLAAIMKRVCVDASDKFGRVLKVGPTWGRELLLAQFLRWPARPSLGEADDGN